MYRGPVFHVQIPTRHWSRGHVFDMLTPTRHWSRSQVFDARHDIYETLVMCVRCIYKRDARLAVMCFMCKYQRDTCLANMCLMQGVALLMRVHTLCLLLLPWGLIHLHNRESRCICRCSEILRCFWFLIPWRQRIFRTSWFLFDRRPLLLRGLWEMV